MRDAANEAMARIKAADLKANQAQLAFAKGPAEFVKYLQAEVDAAKQRMEKAHADGTA